jgi:hypothetical protein
MKNFYFYYLMVLATIGLGSSAQAAESTPIGLDFSLKPKPETAPVEVSPAAVEAVEPAVMPLQIPKDAQIPIGRSDDRAHTALPPAPKTAIAQAPLPEPVPETTPSASNESIGLEFPSAALENIGAAPVPTIPPVLEPAPLTITPTAEVLFEGGSDSLVARAIGSAEGTRTPEGNKTSAYKGHSDPGNGKWNLGTFSYQHGADSPEEADQKQLDRLKQQAQTLQQQAQTYGLALSLAEELNGLDLANQSPRAALSRGGYIDRLKEARDRGLQNEEAILWARTRAFLDPDTNRWNAPGLGNTTERITADQSRRLRAIARSIAAKPIAVSAAPTPPAPTPPRPLLDRIVQFQLQSYEQHQSKQPAYAIGALFMM